MLLCNIFVMRNAPTMLDQVILNHMQKSALSLRNPYCMVETTLCMKC